MIYPGAKRQQIGILDYFPLEDRYLSPFIGGASLELAIVAAGADVVCCDIDKYLINFWQHAIRDNTKLICIIKELRGTQSIQEFKENIYIPARQKLIHNKLDIDIEGAALWWICNRFTFGGAEIKVAGFFDRGEANYKHGLNKLSLLNDKTFTKKMSFHYMDYQDSINTFGDMFIYCDPPYYMDEVELGRLYKNVKSGFNHELLSKMLLDRRRFAISYNDNPLVRRLYKGCRFIEFNRKYRLAIRESHEVLILSVGKSWESK